MSVKKDEVMEKSQLRVCVVTLGVTGREMRVVFPWPESLGEKVPQPVEELGKAFNAKERENIVWKPNPGLVIRVARIDYFSVRADHAVLEAKSDDSAEKAEEKKN